MKTLMKWVLIIGVLVDLVTWFVKTEEGFNLGEIVGTETPEGLVDEEWMERLETMEYPKDFEIVQKTKKIDQQQARVLR